MAESYHDKLKRVRPPRVRIDYKPENFGEEPTLELPFVVGIMADLSADSNVEKRQLKDRKFTSIDRDNFNDIMKKVEPRVAFRVPNRLVDNPNDLLNVELKFESLDEFEPAKVAEKVPVLNELLQMRKQLNILLSKMEGNDALEKLLADVIGNTENKQKILDTLGKQVEETPKAE